MGYGTFGGGQVELHVSIHDDSDVGAWKRCLEEASCMLFRATGGDVRLAKIYVYDATYSYSADAWLYGESYQDNSYFKRLHPTEVPLEPMDPDGFDPYGLMVLAGSAINTPFTVLHEFGHYGFDLGDEYLGHDDKGDLFFTQCTAGQQDLAKPPRGYTKLDHACIMGLGLDVHTTGITRIKADPSSPSGYKVLRGWILEFCNKGNHVANNGSKHNVEHQKQSCKEVIAARRNVQVATNVQAGDGTGCMNIEWPPTASEPLLHIAVDGEFTSVDVPGAIYAVAQYPAHNLSSPDRVGLIRFGEGPTDPAFGGATGLNDAIKLARDDFFNPTERPPVQSLLLLSTGRDSVQAPESQGVAFADKGVRVFTVGMGNDRAGLQQLAQASKGAYFELGESAGGGPGQRGQLLREQIVGFYDQLRYGAPIVNEPMAGGPLKIQVEPGSKALKLVFVQTPGALVVPKITPPGSRTPLDLQRLSRQPSEAGGYLSLVVPEPKGGQWTVGLTNESVAPSELSLAAYSESNRIHVAVSGVTRLKEVGEKVQLRVVVRTPFPVVGLSTHVVRVAAPGAPSVEHALEPHPDGVHRASFVVHTPGAYDVEVKVANEGSAIVAGLPPDEIEGAPQVPLFRRVKRFQVHVA